MGCVNSRKFVTCLDGAASEPAGYITDLSTNGTFVDGEKLEKDKVRILEASTKVLYVNRIDYFEILNCPAVVSLADTRVYRLARHGM